MILSVIAWILRSLVFVVLTTDDWTSESTQ